jgi:hypothetical protein
MPGHEEVFVLFSSYRERRNHDWKKTSLDGVFFPHTTQTCLSKCNIPDIFLMMYGKEAMAAFQNYVETAQKSLAVAGILVQQGELLRPDLAGLIDFLLSSSAHFYSNAVRMIELESD